MCIPKLCHSDLEFIISFGRLFQFWQPLYLREYFLQVHTYISCKGSISHFSSHLNLYLAAGTIDNIYHKLIYWDTNCLLVAT